MASRPVNISFGSDVENFSGEVNAEVAACSHQDSNLEYPLIPVLRVAQSLTIFVHRCIPDTEPFLPARHGESCNGTKARVGCGLVKEFLENSSWAPL